MVVVLPITLPLPPFPHSFAYQLEPKFRKIGFIVVWRDVRNGVGSGFDF